MLIQGHTQYRNFQMKWCEKDKKTSEEKMKNISYPRSLPTGRSRWTVGPYSGSSPQFFSVSKTAECVCTNTQTEPATLRNIHTPTHTQPVRHWCLSLLSVCSAGHTWIIRPSLHCWASLKHGGRDWSWLLRLLHFCTSHC